MPSGLEFAVFVHIVGVFAIAGSTSVLQVCLAMMRRATAVGELLPWTLVASMAERAFLASSVVLLLSGAYLIQEADLSWGDGWIVVSALTLLVAGVVAPHFVSARIGEIHHAAGEAPAGPLPEPLVAQVEDPVLHGIAHALTTALLANVWNMVTKPGVAESLAAVVIAVVAGAGLAALSIQRARQDGGGR